MGEGLATGDVVEFRLLVAPDRGLCVILSQTGTDTTRVASPGNDLDLEVVSPDGTLRGSVRPGEVEPGAGSLPFERVELTPAQVTPGAWTVRVRGAWVPRGREILQPAANPVRAELAQNDPNPVREHTTIRFTLSRPGDILLGVYDIAGRPVRTLASGSRPGGPQAVAWNGRDAEGDWVAPGIYFYRLEGADFDVTRKLVVIR